VANSTKLDTTLAFAIFAPVHGCAFNECGLGLPTATLVVQASPILTDSRQTTNPSCRQ